MAKSGHEPFKAILKSDVGGGVEDRKETPAQARNYLDAMKGLFRWAESNGHISTDPTAGVDNIKRDSGDGFPAWDQNDLAKYRKKWPLGTAERVWCDVLFYTGLRRGDAVCAGEGHISDGLLSLKTEKTGMVMHCVVEPELRATLNAGPVGRETFICGKRGERLTKETFGNLFREACNKAGVKKSAHGLRKLAATEDAERGFTEREMEAKYGWTGGYMASLYTRSADRKRLVIEASRRTAMLAPRKSRVLPRKSPR
jgi:integrase